MFHGMAAPHLLWFSHDLFLAGIGDSVFRYLHCMEPVLGDLEKIVEVSRRGSAVLLCWVRSWCSCQPPNPMAGRAVAVPMGVLGAYGIDQES